MIELLTEKQQQLRKMLYEIFDDRDFVMGIGVLLSGDGEVQQMIDFIESGRWETLSDLTLKALVIERSRAQ